MTVFLALKTFALLQDVITFLITLFAMTILAAL
jgi:hypothetical protein